MITLTCKNCGCSFESVRRAKKFCSVACSNAWNGAHREKREAPSIEKIVWSSGGGIQSTAIAVLICQGILPKPDLALMVDCGYESAQTYDYIREITIPRMAEAGVTFHLVPSKRYVSVDLMSRDGHCNLPAFRMNQDGSVSHLTTHCNGVWKQVVTKKFVKENGIERFEHWLGISTDEARRARKSAGVQYIELRYPLIELGLSREDCVRIIREAGWPVPVRTSCIMCPQRTMFEWLRLKVECPEDFERACEIEDEIRRVDPNVFPTPKCRPLREILAPE